MTCNNTGYKGRIPIFELLPINDDFRELTGKAGTSSAAKENFEKLGFSTLKESGLEKVKEGITTIDEWIRVIT